MATQAEIQRAFLQSVGSVTDEVTIGLLQDALARGDVTGALEVIDLEPAAFDRLRVMLIQTYADSGASETARLSGVRWDGASPRAEEFARNTVGTMIQGITDDSLSAVRDVVADGYAFGRSPARMALDIVGRIGPTGRREGGIVGLNQPQAQWVMNMRRVLETDPKQALRYTKRDRRFDRLLRRGEPLSQSQIDNIIRAYSNRLLLQRGQTIAVTERQAATNQGRVDAFKNAADKYGVGYDQIIKTWVYTNRAREPRVSHVAVGGETVQGLDTPFMVEGQPILYPHAPGLPPRHSINCRCTIKLRFANGS